MIINKPNTVSFKGCLYFYLKLKQYLTDIGKNTSGVLHTVLDALR